jgi:hypothetical protein
MAQEKQTAIARTEPLDTEMRHLIISNGEAFGFAEFEQPARVKAKEFDSEAWLNQHRVTARERRQWWPGGETFYIYRLKTWEPFEGVKLYEGGQVIDEPRLSSKQWEIISTAKDLPKQVVLIDDAVSITDQKEFIVNQSIHAAELEKILQATYQAGFKQVAEAKEFIPLYSLALVRNPRMRVSKKNVIAESETKQEDEIMPFEIVTRGDEFCVINTDTDEISGCHETEEDAEAQIVALRINVEAEEGEAGRDKPKKRKPHKKKEVFGNEESIEQQLNFIRRQFEDEFSETGSDEISEKFIWITDIFESFVIADEEGKLFRVNYMMINDEIVFAPRDLWVEVERGYRPKGFKCLASNLKQKLDDNNRPTPKKLSFLESLKNVGKSIADFLSAAETEEIEDTKLFVSDVGIGQKLVNGEVWHFAYSTNAFEDREGETFSTKALETYVTANESNESKGFFNFWHINAEDGNFNTDFARKEWQGVVGRFLVEAGPYLGDEKGKAAKEFFKEFAEGHPDIAPEGANVWTETRQLRGNKMALSEQQIKAAIEMFGDKFVNDMTQEAETKTAELEAAGVAHKANDEAAKATQPEPQEATLDLDMDALAAEVGKQFTANLEPMTEAIGAMAAQLKDLIEWRAKQEEAQAIKEKTETPKYVFSLQRASEDEKTVVAEDDRLKNQKPNERQPGANDPWSQVFNK